MIKRLLIANRGEIACRIIRTAKTMGITCIAVYAEPDADSLACRLADITYPLGGTESKHSYLSIDKIIEAAKQTGADAIHPGYGFLSENPEFAIACEAAGIIFIGPSIAALNAMGSKQTAKAILSKTEVPLIPGYHGEDQSPAVLQTQADAIGYPVLLKAAAGGGGKGMRRVENAREFADALTAAKREAMASFGDDMMIIEKYLENPRHIEVQILADTHGHVVHLFERDCSIQRRHQKIIEEAPAINLPPAVREAMMAASITVAYSIKYIGAGTIEYLFDGQNFYFMEMNTRLQVEHPITELITGIDIVKMQIDVASGAPLPFTQHDITATGHAIECRIYAEDPYHRFLPSLGRCQRVDFPAVSHTVRVDTALETNSQVTAYYDPMLAKIAVHGENRERAIEIMQTALNQTHIVGVKTNVDFLKRIINDADYRAAKINTHFIDQHAALLLSPMVTHEIMAIAGLYEFLCEKQQSENASPWLQSDGWRANQPAQFQTQFLVESDIHTLTFTCLNDLIHIQFNDGHVITATAELNTTLDAILNGKPMTAFVEIEGDKRWIFTRDSQFILHHFNPLAYYANRDQSGGHLSAPMPGLVVAVLTKTGDKVNRGDNLMVIEAMKMQHTVKAPQDGIITQLYFKTGDIVDEGVELMAFEVSA